MTDIGDINVRRGLNERLTPAEYHATAKDDAERTVRRLLDDFANAKNQAVTLRGALVALMADTVAHRSAMYRVMYEMQDRLAALEAAAQPRLRGVA